MYVQLMTKIHINWTCQHPDIFPLLHNGASSLGLQGSQRSRSIHGLPVHLGGWFAVWWSRKHPLNHRICYRFGTHLLLMPWSNGPRWSWRPPLGHRAKKMLLQMDIHVFFCGEKKKWQLFCMSVFCMFFFLGENNDFWKSCHWVVWGFPTSFRGKS